MIEILQIAKYHAALFIDLIPMTLVSEVISNQSCGILNYLLKMLFASYYGYRY